MFCLTQFVLLYVPAGREKALVRWGFEWGVGENFYGRQVEEYVTYVSVCP